jgi:L-ascorbate metabolism protein UlaG (beta-lactamase superfamily)
LWLAGMTASFPASAEDKGISGDRIVTGGGALVIHPIRHATFLMQWSGKTIYVDPVGGEEPFAGLPRPDLVLVTHLHFDHFDPATLQTVVPAEAAGTVIIVAPKSVAEKIPASLRARCSVRAVANGEETKVEGIAIRAIPAYNTTPGREQFHPQGRDNGYLLTLGGKRVYIAGDTEDTPEMRALEEIDVAFLPMNLPYTMSVEKAAAAIREFKPKVVYPYHYRSGDGTKADFERLKQQLGRQSGVEIRLRDWYPEP